MGGLSPSNLQSTFKWRADNPCHHVVQNLPASPPPWRKRPSILSGNTSMVSLEAKARQLQPFHLLQLHFNDIHDHSITSRTAFHNETVTLWWLVLHSYIPPRMKLPAISSHLPWCWQDQSVSSEERRDIVLHDSLKLGYQLIGLVVKCLPWDW